MLIAARESFAAASRSRMVEVEYLESTGTQYLYIPFEGTNSISSFGFALRNRFTTIPTNSYYGSGYTTGHPEQFFYALSSNANNGLYMCFNGRTDIARNLSANKTIWHDILVSTKEGRVVYSFDGTDVANYVFVSFTLKNIGLFAISNDAGRLSSSIGMQQISSCRLIVNGGTVFDFVPVRFTNELGQSEGAMYDRANPTVGMNPDGSPRADGLYRNRGTGSFTLGPDVY